MAITVNAAQVRQLENKLRAVNEKGIQFAQLDAVNRAAFETQKDARRELGGRMVLRNAWSERSIMVNKANRQTMASAVGSAEEYMEKQETGGESEGTAKHGAVIPTSFSAGQEGAKPRTKLTTRANKMRNVRLSQKIRRERHQMTRRQQTFLSALLAANRGQKHVFIEGGTGASSGIYRVYGKRKKRGRFTRVRMKMVYSMRTKKSKIPKSRWLSEPTRQHIKQLPKYYREALEKQLARLR